MDHTNDAPRPRKAPRLTDDDRRIIAEARKLAALGGDGVRARYPQDDWRGAHARALGAAQFLLGELAAIAERAEPSPPEDTRRLAAIRDLLARFDWEHHDRQLALEAIKRIAEGGTP